MRLTILGAGGQTGSLLVQQAIMAGHSVNALVRDAKCLRPAGNLTVFTGDATRAEDVARASSGTDVIISTIGQGAGHSSLMTDAVTAVVQAARITGVKRFILMSAAHAYPEHLSWGVKMITLVAKETFVDKRRSEEVMKASDLEWTIVRPTLLVNKALGYGLREIPAGTRIGPRHVAGRADVAAWMLKAAEGNIHLNAEVTVSK